MSTKSIALEAYTAGTFRQNFTAGGQTNEVDNNPFNVVFGRWQADYVGSWQYYPFARFLLAVPRASRINAAVVRCVSAEVAANTFTVTMSELDRDGKWNTDSGDAPFSLANYADGPALSAIPTTGNTRAWVIASCPNLGDVFSSADIADWLNTLVNTLSGAGDFDPFVEAKRYWGFTCNLGDAATKERRITRRATLDYDIMALNITDIDAWSELKTANGMSYDSVSGEFRYLDWEP